MSKKIFILGAVIAMVLVAGTLVAINALFWQALSGYQELTDITDIQQLTRISIPASASNLRCATECGIDRLTYGRFDIPERDLGLVLAGMPADEKVRPYEGFSNVTIHKMNEPWWQPERLKHARVANWSMPGFSVNLLFGESDVPGVLTVYFFNFTL